MKRAQYSFFASRQKKGLRLASRGVTGGLVCCSPDVKKKNERFCSSLADPISVAAQEVGQRGFCNTTIHSSGVHTTWLSFV